MADFDNLKEMRAQQQARNMLHINARSEAGAQARAQHFHDAIVDWFIAEFVQWGTSPVVITETFANDIGSAMATIAQSLGETLRLRGAPPPPLGATHEQAIAFILQAEVQKAFAMHMSSRPSVEYHGDGQRALADSKGSVN